MKRNFKDEALKTVNGFEEVKSVVCIVSDGIEIKNTYDKYGNKTGSFR